MRELLPVIFTILVFIAFFLNILGLMRLIPLYITLPLLFLSIYLSIYSMTHKRTFKGMRG
ncbi:hypothetical protein DX933_05920 [Ornithinibacillus gellani]|uniref:hypothetical protein n=1 Tax=Ornithinibacillus gellani TaxID=2293253 RepID=UPI000F46BE36|nr:hypothetical protein [Ornithinibacillus gellani]TQS75805.1 hypothetical protein DX933_05920 [Ornithinibacillus gellani]